MSNKERNRAIDVTKAIGIILVVVGHIPGLWGPLWRAIYSFHMPLFFIMAGAVYVQREPIEVIKKSAKALLIPYLITISVCVLLAYVFGNVYQVHAYCKGLLFPDGIRGDNLVFAGWPSVEAMWFFPAMFCCRSFYSIIMKYASKYTVVLCASIQLVSVLIGRFLFNLPFGILVGCSVLFFFAIGRILTKFAGGGYSQVESCYY